MRHESTPVARRRSSRRCCTTSRRSSTRARRSRSHTSIVVQDWSAEEWTRGCPVAIAGPGTVIEYRDELAKPVGRIHWAGTETVDLLARLHGRRGAVGPARGRRGAGEALIRRAAVPRCAVAVVAVGGLVAYDRRFRGCGPGPLRAAARRHPGVRAHRCAGRAVAHARHAPATRYTSARSRTPPAPTPARRRCSSTPRTASCCATFVHPAARRRVLPTACRWRRETAAGRLYLLDQMPSRVVVLNPRTGQQQTYATFADVPHLLRGAARRTAATPPTTALPSRTTPPGCRTAACWSPTTPSSSSGGSRPTAGRRRSGSTTSGSTASCSVRPASC